MFSIEAIGDEAVLVKRYGLVAEVDLTGKVITGWEWADSLFYTETNLIPTKCPRDFATIADALDHAEKAHRAIGCYD